MNLSDATNFDLFSATIDGEYTEKEIEQAANALGIPAENILGPRQGYLIVEWLEERHSEIVAARKKV